MFNKNVQSMILETYKSLLLAVPRRARGGPELGTQSQVFLFFFVTPIKCILLLLPIINSRESRL